jgi:predicted unusual protein kinase regulating ubiquinone biosynthesis (AarF/ABC1/UbiB family)
MIFSDGLYHADPHPGNILVRPDGGIVFIDFGAVAQLSPAMKEGIPQFLEGVLRRDTEQIVKALKRMGFIARSEGDYNAERIIEYVYNRFLEDVTLDSWNLQDIQFDTKTKFEVLADFRKMDFSLREMTATFRIPKDWVLLERTILLLMGLCTHLSPTMNPMKTIRPYLEEFVLGKDRDWVKMIGSVLKDMALSAITIPEDFKRFLHAANRGELELRVQGLRESVNLLYSLGHQILYGLFAMVSGGFSYLTYTRGEEMLSLTLAGVGGLFLLCLGGSLFLARRRQKRL